MNKLFSLTSLLLGFVLLTSSFTKSVPEETFTIDAKRSSVKWLAKKVGGEHQGSVNLASGQLAVLGTVLKSGSFTVDMTSITCSDVEGDRNKKFVDHLKSDDFFSVDKHPTSQFVIKKVAASGKNRVQVTGELTIKGITQLISFSSNYTQSGKELIATAEHVQVDRTKFDIKYGSKSFFASIGDKAIDNIFELSIRLVANQQ